MVEFVIHLLMSTWQIWIIGQKKNYFFSRICLSADIEELSAICGQLESTNVYENALKMLRDCVSREMKFKLCNFEFFQVSKRGATAIEFEKRCRRNDNAEWSWQCSAEQALIGFLVPEWVAVVGEGIQPVSARYPTALEGCNFFFLFITFFILIIFDQNIFFQSL